MENQKKVNELIFDLSDDVGTLLLRSEELDAVEQAVRYLLDDVSASIAVFEKESSSSLMVHTLKTIERTVRLIELVVSPLSEKLKEEVEETQKKISKINGLMAKEKAAAAIATN